MTMKDRRLEKERARIQEILANAKPGMILTLPIRNYFANPDQPRTVFDETELEATAKSMEGKADVETPTHVVIRQNEQGEYYAFLVDGECRLRAARKAGLKQMSCLVQPPMTDDEIFEKSFLMNMCRMKMTPLDCARGIIRIMRKRNLTQVEVATKMGLSQPTIANLLKLLSLHPDLQAELSSKNLDTGVAMEVATYPQKDQKSILIGIRKEAEKRGGKIRQTDLSRVTKGVAEGLGVKRQTPKKKSARKLLTHAQLVVRRVLQLGQQYSEILRELELIEVEKITGNGIHLLDVLDDLRLVRNILDKQIERIDKGAE